MARRVERGWGGKGLVPLRLLLVLALQSPVTLAGDEVLTERRGPDAVDEVCAMLFRRAGGSAHDREAEERLIDVLRRWPAARVVEAIEREEAGGNLADQLLALRLLGELSDAETVAGLFAQLERFDRVDRQHAVVRRAIETALAALLVREPETYRLLGSYLERLGPVLRESAVGAVGAAGSGAGIPVLRSLTGDDPALDVAVLEALASLRPWDADTLDGDPGEIFSFHLSSPRPEVRRQAAVSVGSIRDGRVFAELIALLDDMDARVRGAALWSLRQISGAGFPAEREMWELLYQREMSWFIELSDGLARNALEADTGAAGEALRVLSGHRIFSRELTEAITPVLFREDEVVATAACEALVRLGDPHAVIPLVSVLSDPREPLRAAALTALETITGEQLGAEPEAWRARIGI